MRIEMWTTEHVGQWLKFLDLGGYRKSFKDNAVGGPELLDLEPEDLVHLGVQTLGHRKRLMLEIKKLRENTNATNSLSSISTTDNTDGSDWSEDDLSSSSSASAASSSSAAPVPEKVVEYIPVKVYYKKKIAVLSVKPNTSLEKLKRMVKSEFRRRLQLQYEDSDGDRIDLKKTSDLKTAFRTIAPPLRLIGSRRQSSRKDLISHAQKDMLETMLDPTVAIDIHGNVLLFNHPAELLFGYSKTDVIGESVNMLMPPTYAAKHEEYMKAYLKTGVKKVIGSGRQVIAQHASGRAISVQLAVSEFKDKKSQFFIGTLRKVEETADNRFTEFKDVNEPVVIIDTVGEILWTNQASSSLWGIPIKEMLGQNVNILMPNPYRDNHIHYMLNYQRTGVSRVIGKQREVVIETADGSIHPVFLSVNEKVYANGEKVFIGLIAKRRVSITKAKTFVQRQRQMINDIQTPSVLIDEQCVIQAFNMSATRLLGYDLSEVLGQNVKMIMEDKEAVKHDQYVAQYLATNVAKIIGSERQVLAKTSEGSLINVKLTVSECREGDRRLFFGMLHAPHS